MMQPTDTTAETATGRYAVLIRSRGLIDQFARREPDPRFDPVAIDAWIWGRDVPGATQTFGGRDEAAGHAVRLGVLFGRYRFSVAEERMSPRWYLADPGDERERDTAIGTYEQI